jgi:hypothetical protein
MLLLARKRLPLLHETEPVWLPDYARVEAHALPLFSLLALTFALLRELSGEAGTDRLKEGAALCGCAEGADLESGAIEQNGCTADADKRATQRAYLRMTEKRFDGVTRCC